MTYLTITLSEQDVLEVLRRLSITPEVGDGVYAVSGTCNAVSGTSGSATNPPPYSVSGTCNAVSGTSGAATVSSEIGGPDWYDPTFSNNTTYDGFTFKGGTSVTGVIHIDYDLSNVVIKNSIIDVGVQNGITINGDTDAHISNITFQNCIVESQPRMGFECTGRDSNGSWTGVHMTDVVFEPQGNQAISYDGNYQDGYSTVDNVTLKGAGNSVSQPWGNDFEINGPSDMTVENCHFYQPRGHILNLQRHVTDACGWLIQNNVFDADTTDVNQTVDMESDHQVVLGLSVYGGSFPGNTITSAAPGGSVAYLDDCHDMDWQTSTWDDADDRGGYDTPTQVDCSGNLF